MNTVLIAKVTDEQWSAITAVLGASLTEAAEARGRVVHILPDTDDAVSSPEPTQSPSVLSETVFADGAWLLSEVRRLQQGLRTSRGEAQAAAIDLALSSPQRQVRRQQLEALPGRAGKGLHGFVKPVHRVERLLAGLGLLAERKRDELLQPVTVAGIAVAYRIGARVIDDGATG